MPRTSLHNVRTEEILDAFERCIEKHTVSGVSLEMIAEEANMKRSVVRHFVGNRDDLLVSLGRRVFRQARDETRDLWRHLQSHTEPATLMEVLLMPASDDAFPSSLVFESLISEAPRLPELQSVVMEWFEGFVDDLAQVLQQGFPEVTNRRRKTAAFGIASAFLAFESLEPLGAGPRYRKDLKTTAEWIVHGMRCA